MARVDHKKIKQLIAQKKKTVTDRQLFTSRAMAAHFEDMAAAQTRRYGYRRRVKVKLVSAAGICRDAWFPLADRLQWPERRIPGFVSGRMPAQCAPILLHELRTAEFHFYF